MNKSDQISSARAYVEEVNSILCELPTPSINAAVMRGAGIRFSSPAEGFPGPRRIVLDSPTSGRPLATGMTAAALLMRQRGNFAYLTTRRERLAHDEAHASKAAFDPDSAGWADHAFEVIDVLRALPLFAGAHFTSAFDELIELAGIEQRGDGWEVRTAGGEWTGVPLDALGRGLSLDSLKAQTQENAGRLLRWRNALRDVGADEEGPYSGISSRPAKDPTQTPSEQRGSDRSVPEAHAHVTQNAATAHHKRALSADIVAERRRRFPELFRGIAFVSGNSAASAATMAARRRRFPELYHHPTPPVSTDLQSGVTEVEPG